MAATVHALGNFRSPVPHRSAPQGRPPAHPLDRACGAGVPFPRDCERATDMPTPA